MLIKYAHVLICICAGEGSRHFSAIYLLLLFTYGMFTITGKLIATISGHECEITDVAWLPPDPTSCDKNMTFISSSRDQHIHIWKFIPSTKEAVLLHVCKGHSRSVEAIAPNPDARKV